MVLFIHVDHTLQESNGRKPPSTPPSLILSGVLGSLRDAFSDVRVPIQKHFVLFSSVSDGVWPDDFCA